MTRPREHLHEGVYGDMPPLVDDDMPGLAESYVPFHAPVPTPDLGALAAEIKREFDEAALIHANPRVHLYATSTGFHVFLEATVAAAFARVLRE